MNLLDLVVKITCDDQASSSIDGISSSLTGKLASAAKVAAAGVATIGAATAALTGAAVSAYSDYQQLTGGVETLFKTSANSLMGYANNAYQTAGMSANTYMETVTSFSASLLQGLGGDTAKAVEIANMAVTDMSDNANKMGTDINMIREAYQGFAKDNYDMLDNLKLGYGGTQAEMARLINDTGVMGDAFKATAENVRDVPFDKMIEAIHQVQTEMGITGTTALEASTTIEGSINSAKAAWENWLAGMANPDADMGALTDQLVQSVIVAGQNIIPAIGEVLTNLSTSISERLPEIFSTIMEGLSTVLPEGAFSTLQTVFNSLYQVFTSVGEAINTYVVPAFQTLVAALGPFVAAITPVVTVLATAIAQWVGIFATGIAQIVGFITTVITAIGNFINTVISVATQVGTAVGQIISFFASLPGQIMSFLSQVISNLAAFVSDVAGKAMEAGSQFLSSIQSGFNSAVEWVSGIPGQIVSALGDLGSLLWDAGTSIINGLWEGMKSAVQGVFDWVGGIAGTIQSLKGPIPYDLKLLIPNGKAIMKSLATGLEQGFPMVEDELAKITSNIEGADIYTKFDVKPRPVDGTRNGDKVVTQKTENNYNFYNPVKTPYETARAIRMQQTYGLAGAR